MQQDLGRRIRGASPFGQTGRLVECIRELD